MMDLVELAGGGPARTIVATAGAAPYLRRFELTIEGESIAKGRPKLASVGGHARAFTPARTRRYEDVVRQRATVEWNGRPLIADTPIDVQLTFVRSVPASWPKKKRAAALAGDLRPMGRPDLDNCCKSVTDALNGVVYFDDALIAEMTARKVYGERPRVEMVLTW